MEKLDCILNLDCLLGIRKMSDKSVVLIITDPPYELQQHNGAGAFGRKNREYHQGIDHLQSGVSNEILEECLRVCKHIVTTKISENPHNMKKILHGGRTAHGCLNQWTLRILSHEKDSSVKNILKNNKKICTITKI